MSGIAKAYNLKVERQLAMKAVWFPGSSVNLGDVFIKKDGVYVRVSNIKDRYGIEFDTRQISGNMSLKFQSQGVRTNVIQGSTSVNIDNINLSAEAKLEISFNRSAGYFVRTPRLKGKGINDILDVSDQIATLDNWKHKGYFIAVEVWEAESFIFLGNEANEGAIQFQGKGDAILELLNAGLSAKVNRTISTIAGTEIIGKTGPIVIKTTRIKRNGGIYK